MKIVSKQFAHSTVHPVVPFLKTITPELKWPNILVHPLTIKSNLGGDNEVQTDGGKASSVEELAYWPTKDNILLRYLLSHSNYTAQNFVEQLCVQVIYFNLIHTT